MWYTNMLRSTHTQTMQVYRKEIREPGAVAHAFILALGEAECYEFEDGQNYTENLPQPTKPKKEKKKEKERHEDST